MAESAPDKPSILYYMTPSFAVAVHLAKATDAEWARYAEELAKVGKGGARSLLVIADGPGPTPAQRRMMKDEDWFKTFRTAVVTKSPVVRVIASVIAWVTPNMFVFAPDQIQAAFECLSIPEDARPRVLDEIASMRARILGGPTARPEDYRLG